jgi:hypothetical protein
MIKQEIFDKVFDNERYANRIVDDYEIAAFNQGYTFDKGSFVKVIPDDKLRISIEKKVQKRQSNIAQMEA